MDIEKIKEYTKEAIKASRRRLSNAAESWSLKALAELEQLKADIEKAKKLLRIAETKCLCTDDRLRPLKEIQQALASLEQPASPLEPKVKKAQAGPGELTKEFSDALTNGVGEKPYYRKEENQFNIYVADDQLMCIVPLEEGPEGDYAEYIAKAICEAGLIIDRLTSENKQLITNRDCGCDTHTIDTAVDIDGCCISCGEDLNFIAQQGERIEKLLCYVTHYNNCESVTTPGGKCTCGFEQALPAPVSPSAPKETQAQVKEKAPAANERGQAPAANERGQAPAASERS